MIHGPGIECSEELRRADRISEREQWNTLNEIEDAPVLHYYVERDCVIVLYRDVVIAE